MRTVIARLGFLVMALGLCLPGAGQAQTVYSIAVEDIDLSPFARVESGVYTGLARDLLDRFAASQGIAFEYRPMPLRRLIVEFLEGAHDFKFPDNSAWRVDLRDGKQIRYSGPVIRYTDGVYVRPESLGRHPGEFASLSILRGFTPLPGIEGVAATKFYHADMPSMLRFALSGRVDAVFGTIESMRHHLKALQQPGALVFDPSLPHKQDYYRLSTIKHPELIDRLDEWFSAQQPEIARIRQRWGVVDEHPNMTAQAPAGCRGLCRP